MDSSDTFGQKPPGVDTSKAHAARVWNYLLGGKDNYPADWEVAERFIAIMPSIVDLARADRAFLGRVVRYLAGEVGIRQFLDIGTGLPTANNTHEVAQTVAPECRIVYADNDPLVLVHARALLTSSPEGATDYVDADLRDPDMILREAARTLDFTEPIGLMLLAIVDHILDTDEVAAIVNRLLDALPPGSFMAMTHATAEIDGELMLDGIQRWNEGGAIPPLTVRSLQEITRFFDGVELLEPGVVSCSLWRPDPRQIGHPVEVDLFGGVGRKP